MRDAIGSFSGASTIDFDTEGKPEIPLFQSEGDGEGEPFAMPKVDFDPQYNPFNSTPKSPSSFSGGHGAHGGASIFSGPIQDDSWDKPLSPNTSPNTFIPDSPASDTLFSGPVQESGAEEIEDKSPSHYQYKGKYIMTAVKSGLMVLDQHRAHICILYEDYMRRLASHKMHSQKVLFPESIDLTPKEMVTLTAIKDDIALLGFELTPVGAATYSINAIPEGFEGVDVISLLHEILSDADTDSQLAKIHECMALSLARAAAIPYGQVLSNEEMENIINQLFQCSNVNYTPDGHATLCIIKQKDIENMLG